MSPESSSPAAIRRRRRILPIPFLAAALLVAAASPPGVPAAAVALAARDEAAPGGGQSRGLTNGPELAHIYDLILDARFEEAEAALARACPPAPAVACQMLGAVSLWWRIQLDPNSRALDRRFEERVDQAIAAAGAWTTREPRRAEAWFYLGAGYGVRVQYRALRGQRLAAARDGKKIKDALEQSLAIDPGLADAHFGIGLYHYYADVAPAALKFLRWLLLLPGGDRVQGLAEMATARTEGALLRGEGDFQVHLLYLWYEEKPQDALALLEGLRARYPHNPIFVERIAEVQHVYVHDEGASLAAYESLLALAASGQVGVPEVAEVTARLGAARQLDLRAESDRAIEVLTPVAARRPVAPYGAAAEAALGLGLAEQRLGHVEAARAALDTAVALAPPDDPLGTRARANDARRRWPAPGQAEAYRVSLEGWRALERGALDEADRALARAVALDPSDPVIRYRRARLLAARRDHRGALAELERVMSARPPAPPSFLAASCLDAARLLEAQGQRVRAVELYRRARAVHGADRRTRDEAARALGRLT